MSMHSVRQGDGQVRRKGERIGEKARRWQGQTRSVLREVQTGGNGETLAKGLGLFSIALGLAEVAAPRQLLRMIGVPEDEAKVETTRVCGVREIASGIGLLTHPQPLGYLWSRVGGDAMDLALLAGAARSPGAEPGKLALAAAAVAGVTLLDVVASQRMANASGRGGMERTRGLRGGDSMTALGAGFAHRSEQLDLRKGVHVLQAVTVNKSPEELYQFWRSLENLPRIMTHLESVRQTTGNQSRWRAKIANGPTIEWDAEITKDQPNEIITWRSLAGADIPNGGSVRFNRAPGDRGTDVVVELYYQPPGGVLARAFAKMFNQVPQVQILQDLRRFKQVMELGEIVRSDASLHRGMHPARPPATRVTPDTDLPASPAPQLRPSDGAASPGMSTMMEGGQL